MNIILFIQCNRGRSLDAFFDDFLLQPDSVKIALIGCGCSVATEPVAEISHKWNISQVPYMHTRSIETDFVDLHNMLCVICIDTEHIYSLQGTA